MQWIRDLPLRYKLLLGILATCMAALTLACSALFWFQSVTFRKGFVAEQAEGNQPPHKCLSVNGDLARGGHEEGAPFRVHPTHHFAFGVNDMEVVNLHAEVA